MFKHELGIVVKSNITGFKGMVTARSQHLNGCDRYWVQPPVDKQGKSQDGTWFDEGELEVVSGRVKTRLGRTNNDRGGFPSKIK